MIELPEAIVLAKQANAILQNKVIKKVHPATKEHKFTWFVPDKKDFGKQLEGRNFSYADYVGFYFECDFEGIKFAVRDGVIPRYYENGNPFPKTYQLLLEFTDGSFISYSVAMYGGFHIFNVDKFDDQYYLLNKNTINPLNAEFNENYFKSVLREAKPTISVKEFLATKQRFPGLGNGVLQDILFCAHIHPKRKINTLSDFEIVDLHYCINAVLSDMTEKGGRDTEKDLLGNIGGYKTLLSKKSYKDGCHECGGEIVKQAYLGGSVYFCPRCQRLED